MIKSDAIFIFLSIDYGKCRRFKRYKGDWSPPLCGLQRHLAVMPVGNLMPTDHGGDQGGQHLRLHCTLYNTTEHSGQHWRCVGGATLTTTTGAL